MLACSAEFANAGEVTESFVRVANLDLRHAQETGQLVAPTDAAWRHETKEAAEFRCFVCRAKDLNDGNSVAHKVHIETEEEVIDSMVMCNDCSLLFHKKYGFTGNTSDQYEEFCLEHSKHTGIESTMRKIDWQIK